MAGDDFDDLYGDLYGDDESTLPPTASTSVSAPAPPVAAAAPAATPANTVSIASSTQIPASAGLPANPGIPPFQNQLGAQAGGAGGDGQANQPPPQRVRPSDMPEEGKMFVGGLNWDTTDDALRAYFSQFGRITHSTIMRDVESGRSRGFAFLTFENPESVNTVMSREHYLDGKTIDPKRAIPRNSAGGGQNNSNFNNNTGNSTLGLTPPGQEPKTDKLFVRALPLQCTPDSFREFWRQFGEVTDATLMMDKETGRHRGFGFVNYANREDVEKVLQLARGEGIKMDEQLLEVKRAQTKADHLANQAARAAGGGGHHHNNNQNHNQHYQPSPNYGNNNTSNQNTNQGNNNFGQGNTNNNQGFDPNAMAKFFQQMTQQWGGWNPMMGGMGGMGGMPGMPGMGGMGMPGMGGMGMGMGGFPMMGMDPSMYGQMGGFGSPMGAGGMGAVGGDETMAGAGEGEEADTSAQQQSNSSQWAAPMAANQPLGRTGGAGGRGGGRAGGAGGRFNPPSGPAAMRGDEASGSGTGPQRNRGTGAGFHPYSR